MQIIAERSAAVGVLYIVYAQHGTKNPKASGLSKYLKEAAHSSLTLLRLNPLLPVALSTTESEALEQWVRNAFTLVVKLSAAKKHEPLWVPRLRALAESPFSLTLAMDSHATACSPELHTALLQEHHRAAYDLAVNFEAQACLRNAPKRSRNGIGRVYASTHASEMLPHNWAMVINKGAGLTSLFRVWRHALERMHARRQQPDDQWALTMTLRRLRNTGGCADHLPSPPGLLRRHLNASEPCLQRIRIRHLLDSAAAGFKSADKSRLNFFPRYTRLLIGPVLVTHALKPYPWLPAAAPRNVCALLNAEVGTPRLVLLTGSRDGYSTVKNASHCRRHLAERAGTRVARVAAPICRIFDVDARAATRATSSQTQTPRLQLTEPIEAFWARLSRIRAPRRR